MGCGEQWVIFNLPLFKPAYYNCSFRFLYQLERVLWCNNRMLYPTSLPHNVCWTDVRLHPNVLEIYMTKIAFSFRLSYTWINHERQSVHLPAPTYIDYVMTWCQNLLNDETTFPTKSGHEFPPSFPSTIKHIYRQLLRVFAHIYHAHFHQILHLRSEPHFNSLFAHFLSFGREYELLEVKDVKGGPSAPVGIGPLWEKWKEMGILEG